MSASIPRFHRLAVNDLRRESPDAVSLTFAIPNELADDYHFAPGQYLTLRTTMDGEEVRRSYSICSGPDDGELRIAVKKVDGGAFSSWAADELKAAAPGSVEAWGRAEDNPVGGWYGVRKGYRGRFGMYLPPLLEELGLVELTHDARNNSVRAR